MSYQSEKVTRGVCVTVESFHVPGRSAPERGYYFFAYRVTIENEGDTSVQLISRHWVITNANGEVKEVRGPGVAGEQPVMEPGEAFEYTSFCPLPTPVGAMNGSYQMVDLETGEEFDAEIAPFTLAEPGSLH